MKIFSTFVLWTVRRAADDVLFTMLRL